MCNSFFYKTITIVNVKLIAHRGIHSATVRENSRQSLAACIGSQADGVEVDVRITADGICVVHHDTRLHTGNRISRLTYSELSAIDREVIRADEALEIVRTFSGLINLEVKHLLGERDRFRGLACVEQLSKDVDATYESDKERSRVLVSSFSLPNVKGLNQAMPHIARAYLAPRSLSFSRMIARATRYECSAIHVAVAQMKARRFGEFVRNAHDSGFLVRVFTINTERDFDIARANGVDAIFTDDIDAMGALQK